MSIAPDPEIDRHFNWLRELGYEVLARDKSYGGPNTTYGNDQLLIDVSYHWHDTYAQIILKHRQKPTIEEEPFWSRVNLEELLARRAPHGDQWHSNPPDDRHLDGVFETGAMLLREYAADLLSGTNLNELDEIVRQRPHAGVPGLDFPTTDAWFPSQEGLWFPTDMEMPQPLSTYLERTRSTDARVRASAALKLWSVGSSRTDDGLAHDRLHELLADDDADVRRAAATSLGMWTDPDALEPMLALLGHEPGDKPSTVAAALTFLAANANNATRTRVLESLRTFRAKGDAAAAQFAELEGRLQPDARPVRLSRLFRR